MSLDIHRQLRMSLLAQQEQIRSGWLTVGVARLEL